MTAAEKREAFASQAEKYAGVDSSAHFVQVYNNYLNYECMYQSWPWCAVFVSAIGIETGLQNVIPQSMSCCQMITMFEKQGRFVEDDNYTPRRGDVIFFDWEGSADYDSRGATTTDHVGIVVDVHDGLVYTIEGNRSSKVMHASYPIGARQISGYGVPNYGDDDVCETDAPAALPLIKYGSKGNAVKAAQALLNTLGNAYLDVDGEFGDLTKSATKRWQTKHTDSSGNYLEPDGEIGPCTWSSFFIV